jgi:membrane protein DedA with SNARE-associated domain/rhodanese-related sulfurtransferase
MLHDLLARYGPGLVFVNVLAASLGLPVPALPTVIMVGASIMLAHGAIWPHLIFVLVLSVCASLLGDAAWFGAGRRYGGKTLSTLCKLSLSRDACVKQTERFFGRWGVRVLVVAKFIPGLSMVSVPLAGAMGVRLSAFLKHDGVGAALWACAGLALGASCAYQLDALFAALGLYGSEAGSLAAVALALYIAYRWWRRHALLKTLETARMSVNALHAALQAGAPLVIFDIRSPEKRQLDPYVIPGAQFADERQLDSIAARFERNRQLVIYCSCPNEVSAAWMAQRLRQLGFLDAIPLLGGLEAWRDAGWPLAPLSQAGAAAPAAQPLGAAGTLAAPPCPGGEVCAAAPPPAAIMPAGAAGAAPGELQAVPQTAQQAGALAHDAASLGGV